MRSTTGSDVTACVATVVATALAAVLPAYAQSVTGAVGGFEPHFVEVDGIRTRYYDVGAGEPMLLVHGSGFTGTASANDWTPTLEGFARRFRVLAVDKLGSGLTGNPADPHDLTIAGEVDHLAAFIRTLELMTPAQRRRNAELTSRMLYDAYHRIGTERALEMPVLLYWSKDDPQAVPAQGFALYDIIAEANPRTRFLMVNHAGHAHFRELPDEFVDNVTHFVTFSVRGDAAQ